MILDRLNVFSSQQAVTTGTTVSTNVIDLGAAGDSAVNEQYLVVMVDTALTSSGSATVDIRLYTDGDVAFGSATQLWASGAVAYDNAVFAVAAAGAAYAAKPAYVVRVPKGCERYLRVSYVVATAALTAGKFDAFLTDSLDNSAYFHKT